MGHDAWSAVRGRQPSPWPSPRGRGNRAALSHGGRVRLNGYDVQRQRGAAMRQIGAVLEGTRNVHWRLSAWQNLQYFGGIKGCAGAELHGRAEALLRDL